MRPRFLAIVASERSGPPVFRAERLSAVLPIEHRSDGLRLHVASEADVVTLPIIDGAVIGTVFDRCGRTRQKAIESAGQLAIESTAGSYLIERHSGAYVAIWRRHPGGPFAVLRDPSGAQPALYHRVEDAVLIASDPDILRLAGVGQFAVDWEMIAHHLRFPSLPTSRTCLAGICEALPGERIDLTAPPSAMQLWRPSSFVEPFDPRADPTRATSSVRGAIEDSVAGWSNGVERSVVELSGGLDSSIVASCLDAAGRPWRAVTVATAAADGDERPYARLVAERFGVDLAEHRIEVAEGDLLEPPARLTPRPSGGTSLRGADRVLASAYDELQSDMVFSGTGGDNVFCSIRSTAPVLDAWLDHGFSSAMRTSDDVARLTRTTVSDVIGHAARRWCADRIRRRRWPHDGHLLARGIRPSLQDHPWLAAPMPYAGTRAHIAGLLRIHNVLDAHDRAANYRMVFPLICQPVMEACLSIPSYLWIAEGRDRAVARWAFLGRVPDPILDRTGKGRLDSMLAGRYVRTRQGLRGLLCGGALASAGLLDVAAVAAALARDDGGSEIDRNRILMLADTELWVRSLDMFGSDPSTP